jgi:hypothetical protein
MTHLRGPDKKSVGKPDAGKRHVRFDERGRETGLLAPRPSSTLPIEPLPPPFPCFEEATAAAFTSRESKSRRR